MAAQETARLRDFDGRIAVLEGDIAAADTGLCQELAGHDVLLHLAWDGLPNYRSLRHFEQELPAQYAFLRSVIAAGLKSLMVTGTCFEYGMQSGLSEFEAG
jgi:dTDP-6-deoxy-L-talose 4-dehydrogenase (NAD+)